MPLSLDFEEQSFRNLVLFYREELEKIHKGVPVTEVFPGSRFRVKLRRDGVIRVKNLGRHLGKGTVLTDRAKTILGLT